MTAVDIVRRKGNDLDDHTIREELEGNICRCTGYHNIVKAIAAGAKAMRGSEGASKPPNNQGRDVGTATGCPGERIAGGQCHERNRDRRFSAPQGRPAFHHWQRPLHRRHQPAGAGGDLFFRSPHAHARIKSIDTAAAAKMPGVAGVFTGEQFAEDKLGNLICGWTVLSKDGSPMKMAPHAALAAGKANHVGDAVAVVIADTLAQAKDAAEKVVVDYEPLPAVVDLTKLRKKARRSFMRARRTTRSTIGISATRPRPKRRSRTPSTSQTRIHQQPAGTECHGAAGGAGRIRFRERPSDLVERDAEPACRPPRDRRLCRHGARAQIARHRARRRRWLWFENLYLS